MSIEFVRSAPVSLEEAGSYACAILEESRVAHPHLTPYLTTLTKVNNAIVVFLRNHPGLMIPGDHPILLSLAAAVSIPTSFAFSVAAVCVSYYVLYLLASQLQKIQPLLGAYRQEMNKLVDETSALLPTRLYELCEEIRKCDGYERELEKTMEDDAQSKRINLDKIRAMRLFFEVVLQSILKKMETSGPKSRFIYEVRHEETVTGYLIGTMHKHNWKVVNDPAYFRTLNSCALLFTEISGEDARANFFVRRFWGSDLYRYCLDRALARYARGKNILNKKLDTKSVLEKVRAVAVKTTINMKSINEALQANPEYQNRLAHWLLLDRKTVTCLAFHSYLTGNEEELIAWDKTVRILNPDLSNNAIQRTLGWLNGKPQLLARFKGEFKNPRSDKDPIKPICVAAGALHMLGDEGLVVFLQKEGLTVTRLSNGPQATSV